MRQVCLLVLVLAALPACAGRTPSGPVAFRFQPGARLSAPVATLAAVPLETELAAREIEAAGADYLGELSVVSGSPTRSALAEAAASRGATHFRVVPTTGADRVVLYHVARTRWRGLPVALRPGVPYGQDRAEHRVSRAL